MGHVVLLGDSIFDNAAYVPGGPAVIDHLTAALPHGWRETLLAVDGAGADDVATQLRSLPADATHLVVSAGGNDALGHSGLFRHGSAVIEPSATGGGKIARAVGRVATGHDFDSGGCRVYG